MMLALLYHRVGDGRYANPLSMLERHFALISQRYRTVWPGDPLELFGHDICLTFDDATFDFYHFIYPLLKRFHLRALLAVPTHYILDTTDIAPSIRLNVPGSIAMKDLIFQTHASFCTWQEIHEMVQSNLVQVASHSMHHQNLLVTNNLNLEITGSKRIIEEKLQVPVRTFVYPYGKFDASVQKEVRKHYPYAMRIGSALNLAWRDMIYRISADNMKSPDQAFSFPRKVSYLGSYFLNTLRKR